MAFVVDASIAAAWLLPDETHPLADKCRLLLLEEEAVVPSLWWFEVRNLLIVAERRGRINEEECLRALISLAAIPIARDEEPEETSVMALARKHRLTFYDASYLELAQRRALPIATLDRALTAAARSEDCPLLATA